ncbi:MAG TPA: nucleoside triphosphate pyrophosphatase [Bacteroidota bacterium]
MKTPPIILASRSPRRNILLKQIGLKFKTHPSRIPEDFDFAASPAQNAKRIALAKAREVSKYYTHAIVVSADTIVVLGKRMLGTPATRVEAVRMLRALSGNVHTVITAFVLLDCRTGRQVVSVERTKVTFRNIEPDEIKSYVASGSPMDKAGAYGIQDDYGAVFVEKINGCFYNVVGFPLMQFHRAYREFRKQLHYT